MISIVDYGMGNLRSVQKAFERQGFDATITSDPDAIRHADRLVLPGVGAFKDAIDQLRAGGLEDPIRDHLAAGRPFLGICLGLQLLFDVGLEDGEHRGLGVISGKCLRFQIDRALKVPHMGWNEARTVRRAPALAGLPEAPSVYFVHSYHVVPDDPGVVATVTDYGGDFVSSIWKDNLFATQFHPEKSQAIGLALLANFARG